MTVEYKKEGRIAYITLNLPKLNVINLEMVSKLHEIWGDFRDDGFYRADILYAIFSIA